MSDSDGEGAAGAGGDGGLKKDFKYKLKAFKRRALHSITKATGKIDVTKDSQYENLFADFVEADARMATLLKSVKKYNDAQMQLSEAAAQLADDLHILYDKDAPMLLALPSQLKQIHDNLSTSVVPQLAQRWGSQVVEPIDQVMTKRYQEIKDDEMRRQRYMSDYDHYKNKKAALEVKQGADKVEKLRENELKLKQASDKFFTMQQRLSHRVKIADKHKACMLNEPMLAMIAIQNDLFLQASNDLQKLYCTSRETKYIQAARSEAEELAKADGGAGMPELPFGSVFSVASSSPAQRTPGGPTARRDSSPSGSPRGMPPPSSIPPAFDAASSGASGNAGGGPDTRKRVRCLFGYDATADIELDMKEGDIIYVIREDDSGWWQGEVDGKVGWFPFNYVEPI
mmetsp:Transcript_40552/g.96022  ORF Transcript_40552/g.96022 Transcript_40552/m.96022 type:complete len:399 (+) Transcript_40552:36-1232(+)|eukprot:CAMPEP_0180139552 /NCGR_PEP_ID=MMETSP0986-20121125/13609_1 /TAXON_ID=697907 /ORGANISM="non described non described, Strain CCMP2293" /LENGTH=398 /DNA_ID=CAMNT_0022081693 /DNA_START=36 /DNA_END=1232 /DNA_ORIENTATION=-